MSTTNGLLRGEFYAPEELQDLTGAKRKADQVAWLRANRIPHFVGADGYAKVLRATVAAILGAPANSTGPQLRLSGAK
jgi:hypothetical protein